MSTYIKVNDIQYPATITGRLADKEWDNRASKAIKVEMTYEDAAKLFMDDIEWYIVQENEVQIEKIDEEGNATFEPSVETEEYDNSEYCIAGSITDHRDGTITVKMGKPTAEELLIMLEEVL